MCSSAPDPDPLIGQSAMANAEIAKQALQYYKERDAANAPRQEAMDALTTKLAEQSLSSSKLNDSAARQQLARYNAYGIPAENAMYDEAATYDNQAALDKAAGEAGNDVAATAAKSQDAMRRQLARAGVNPADGRALAAEQDMAANTALAEAGAMNGARNQRRQMGTMLRKDAASFARGATGTAAQTFGTSMAAGGAASGAIGSSISSANQSAATMAAGFGTAIGANNSAGSILSGLYGTTNASNNASNSSTTQGIAGLAAAAAMAY